MGKRGPKPKPTALRVIHGNPAKRPLPEGEPMPGIGLIPSAPEWLGKIGTAVWNEESPKLRAAGLLTSVDSRALSLYCEAWDDFFEARQHIEKNGSIAIGKNGPYQHPAVGMKNKAIQRIKQIGAEFGMTPSSRTGINLAVQDTADPFEQFLARKKS